LGTEYDVADPAGEEQHEDDGDAEELDDQHEVLARLALLPLQLVPRRLTCRVLTSRLLEHLGRPAQSGDYATVGVDEADGDQRVEALDKHTQVVGVLGDQRQLDVVIVNVEYGCTAQPCEGQQTEENRHNPARHAHGDHVAVGEPRLELCAVADAHQAAHGDPEQVAQVAVPEQRAQVVDRLLVPVGPVQRGDEPLGFNVKDDQTQVARVAHDQIENEDERRVLFYVAVQAGGDEKGDVGEEANDATREDDHGDFGVEGELVVVA